MGKLTNKIALVTGAGTRLGRGIALTFANAGATVVLNGRREECKQVFNAIIIYFLYNTRCPFDYA